MPPNMGLIKVALVGGIGAMSGSRCANGLAKEQHLAADECCGQDWSTARWQQF